MSDRMPKVDLSKLSSRDREFIERISKENQNRVARLKKVQRNNLITAGILGSIVVGIYGYTIYAVKQETFLDDFEEPAKIIEKPNKLLRAIKQLSQNFLLDERITDKLVRAAGNITGHYVCEVGPGPGSITRSILKRQPRRLIVVEKDPRFIPTLELLKESCKDFSDMQIEVGDIKNYNLEKGLEGVAKRDWDYTPPPAHLIGNLPFSVSTNLIIRWLQSISEKSSAWSYGRTPMTLTFQKEVGERMVAPMGSKQRCRLSVMCQLWCDVQYKFTIPGKAFVPKPEVDVAVVTLTPLRLPLIDAPFNLVEKVLRTIFHMRQKYCDKAIMRLFPDSVSAELTKKLVVLAEINPTTRPFELSNEDFVRICYAYKMLCDEHPGLREYDHRMPRILRENYSQPFGYAGKTLVG